MTYPIRNLRKQVFEDDVSLTPPLLVGGTTPVGKSTSSSLKEETMNHYDVLNLNIL